MARHPSTVHMMRTLLPNPALPNAERGIAAACYTLAEHIHSLLGDGAELTAGLRKLREAKDCFVIQSLVDQGRLKD